MRYAAAIMFACLLASGCEALQEATLPPPEPPLPKHQIGYGRLGVVEFYNRTPYEQPAQFAAQLREKLAHWTTSTDVVLIPQSDLPGLEDPFRGGRIPLSALVAARERYLVDAVVIGSVDEHSPYWKPTVHVSLKVVDTATAAIPFALSDGWDANRQADREQIDIYYRRNRDCDDCRFGPELFVTSPSYFLRFVADSVAQRIATALSGESASVGTEKGSYQPVR